METYEYDFIYKKYLENFNIIDKLSGINGTNIMGYDTKKISVALFGLGRIGVIHLKGIKSNPRIKLKYLVEEDMEKGYAIKSKWMLNKTKLLHPKDMNQIFNDKDLDACIIGTPTTTHYELVIKSLQANKSVLCEKPLANTIEQVKHCYKLAKDKKLTLLCAFNRRFDPCVKQIKSRISKNELGQLQIVKSTSRDSPRPSLSYILTSGGIFHDCLVHDLDLVCSYIVNELPTTISSQASCLMKEYEGVDDFDNVVVSIKFPSGIVSVIDASRNSAYGYDQRLEILGDKGMIQMGSERPTNVTTDNCNGTSLNPIYYSFASRYEIAYLNELDHFVNCIKGLETVSVKVQDIITVFKLCSAAEESARNEKVVKLQW